MAPLTNRHLLCPRRAWCSCMYVHMYAPAARRGAGSSAEAPPVRGAAGGQSTGRCLPAGNPCPCTSTRIFPTLYLANLQAPSQLHGQAPAAAPLTLHPTLWRPPLLEDGAPNNCTRVARLPRRRVPARLPLLGGYGARCFNGGQWRGRAGCLPERHMAPSNDVASSPRRLIASSPPSPTRRQPSRKGLVVNHGEVV